MALKEITNSGQIKSASALPTSAGWTRICDSLLGGSQATFDTNTILGGNIPQNYTHLRLLATLRNDTAATGLVKLNFNNDTTSVYRWASDSVSGAATATGAYIDCLATNPVTGTGTTAGHFSTVEIDLFDYTNASLFKQARGQYFTWNAATTMLGQGFWGSYAVAAAVTRIGLSLSAGNFVTGSRFTLYGL